LEKPDYLVKIERLGLSISRLLKIDNNTARLIAHGVIEKLRLACWENLDDVLGRPDDIELICRWQHREGWLAKRLADIGFVAPLDAANADGTDAVYLLANVAKDLPEYIRKKWRRYEPAKYEQASQRVLMPKHRIARASPRKRKIQPTQNGLDHRELIEFWVQSWSKKYHGRKYPFVPRDAVHIAALLKQFKDKSAVKKILTGYIDDKDAFVIARGHNLSTLIGNLPRYCGPQNGAGDAREIPYGGDTNILL
jgi:hypothetical protein